MRARAYTISLVLIGCVLVGALHAQEGNIFKEPDLRQLRRFSDKLYNFNSSLGTPKENVCGTWLRGNVSHIVRTLAWVEELVLISSKMRSKEDEEFVNRRLFSAMTKARIAVDCPPMTKEATEMCAADATATSKVSELKQICSEGATLLNYFQDLLKN
jgi:hypothetical protein